MSKFAQLFSPTRPTYKLNEKTNILEKTEEVIEIQEEVNSSYDETMFYRLESFFNSQRPNIQITDAVVDDYEAAGNDADVFLNAQLQLTELRARYELPSELYSDSEALAIIRERAQISGATATTSEGGESDEKNSEQKSE